MKLEKFKKYGKRNKKIIGSVIGIILIICGVLLLKSFAFFENQYNFDVIKGRIPPFNVSDVTLAFTINGEKSTDVFPTEGSGYFGKSVTCQNGVTAEWNNITWALEHINSNGQKKINCNIDFTPYLYSVVNVGNYVSYTPSKTSYTIPKTLTGYSSDQTINPSELDLWRVIKKNEDGTIEMVSEYVSSTDVYFYGKTGYFNYVGALNTIAKQYETNGITIGSRYLGYNGQTEYITDTSIVGVKGKGWLEATNKTNSPVGSVREKQGGGDWAWENDTSLVEAALGNLKAQKKEQKGTTTYSNYRVAGRYFEGSSKHRMCHNLDNLGTEYSEEGNAIYWNFDNGWVEEYTGRNGLRPIIILSRDLIKKIGDGSISSPYKIN